MTSDSNLNRLLQEAHDAAMIVHEEANSNLAKRERVSGVFEKMRVRWKYLEECALNAEDRASQAEYRTKQLEQEVVEAKEKLAAGLIDADRQKREKLKEVEDLAKTAIERAEQDAQESITIARNDAEDKIAEANQRASRADAELRRVQKINDELAQALETLTGAIKASQLQRQREKSELDAVIQSAIKSDGAYDMDDELTQIISVEAGATSQINTRYDLYASINGRRKLPALPRVEDRARA